MDSSRQSGFAVVGAFLYPHEAHLAQAVLEGEGVPAWIFDEHGIRMQWHLATAFGGVKVVVRPEDAARARAILAEDRSAALEQIPESALPAAEEEHCPVCRGTRTTERRSPQTSSSMQWMQSLAFLFTFDFLVPRRTVLVERSCATCGHEWTDRRRR